MFFTRIGKIVAHLMLWLGVFRVGMGFIIAYGTPDMESNRLAARHYLAASTTGDAINQGMISVLAAVALGVLCEISARRNSSNEQA